jgi:hypothetical protein
VLRLNPLHVGLRRRVLLRDELLFLDRLRLLHRLFLRVFLFRPDADCERQGTAYQDGDDFFHSGSLVNSIFLPSPTVSMAGKFILIRYFGSSAIPRLERFSPDQPGYSKSVHAGSVAAFAEVFAWRSLRPQTD